MDEEPFVVTDASDSEARRAFLVRCGRFAVITPPAIATVENISAKKARRVVGEFRREAVPVKTTGIEFSVARRDEVEKRVLVFLVGTVLSSTRST